MKPDKILEEQRILVKRGRMNGLGYEPAWNCFFDFYLSTRYINPPLLQLEDVTFFLFIRKNINDNNPDWHMPSIRQIKKKFGVGQGKIEAMMKRLERAHLLKKVSGVRTNGPNVHNDYELSDPVPVLDEFLLLLEAGVFDPVPETGTPPVPEMGAPYVPETGTPPVLDLGTDQQTSIQQTDDKADISIWQSVKALLKQHLPAESYRLFLEDAEIVFMDETRVIVSTRRPQAKDFIETRLAKRIIGLLNTELRLINGAESGTITDFEVQVASPTVTT